MNDVWTEAELIAATNGGFPRGGFAASAIRTDSRDIKAGVLRSMRMLFIFN
jgi:hypothetical protein